MEYAKYCIPVIDSALHNDKHIANGGHLSHNVIHCSRKLCISMYQVIKIHLCAWERITMACLQQTTQCNCIFVNHRAVFLYSTLDILWHIKYCFLFLILPCKVQ